MTVIDASDANKEILVKGSDQTVRNFNVKLMTTAYKSNVIRFKMDEDPLQRQIYFLTFVESLEMIFSQYKETCEVLLNYSKIGGDDIIEDYAKRPSGTFCMQTLMVT